MAGGLFDVDLAGPHEVEEGPVHGLHALSARGLHERQRLVHLVVADDGADGVGGDHGLEGCDAALAVCAGEEPLAHNAEQRGGELRPHLGLLVGGEDIDDPVDGLDGIVGVQRGQNEVARLGGGKRRGDGLEVAHLADEDDVGVLAQHMLECCGEGVGVGADLALVDGRHPAGEDILDGVFDRDDAAGAGGVDALDEAGQRGGLAGSRGSDDEQQPLVALHERLHLLGDTEQRCVSRQRGDEAECGGHLAPLEVGVDAEALAVVELHGEVELPLEFEDRALAAG